MRSQSLKATMMMAAALGASVAENQPITLKVAPNPSESHYRVGKSHRLGGNLAKVKAKRKKRNRDARRRARVSQRAAR